MLCKVGYGVRGDYFGGGHSSSGPVDSSLHGVLPSTVFDLDATMAASYGGTGLVWANLVATPADGAMQTAYDFQCGDGATPALYPTFVGIPDDAGAYWAFDGNDYFLLNSGAHTDFLKNLHKSTGGQDFWLAFAWRTPAADTSFDFLFTTQTSATQPGIVIYQDAGERIVAGQRGDTNSSTHTVSTPLAGGSDYLCIFTHSHAENKTRVWVNTATSTLSNQTYQSTVNDAVGPARISGRDGAYPLGNGARLYGIYMGNEYLDDPGAAAIIAALESRHDRDYTP